jgi:hypothetical protein
MNMLEVLRTDLRSWFLHVACEHIWYSPTTSILNSGASLDWLAWTEQNIYTDWIHSLPKSRRSTVSPNKARVFHSNRKELMTFTSKQYAGRA